MINFRVNIRLKSMLRITHCKKCCIIKSMSSIMEFISLNIQIRSEEIEKVIKCESVIWRPECFNVILNSEGVKIYLLLRFRFLFYYTMSISFTNI